MSERCPSCGSDGLYAHRHKVTEDCPGLPSCRGNFSCPDLWHADPPPTSIRDSEERRVDDLLLADFRRAIAADYETCRALANAWSIYIEQGAARLAALQAENEERTRERDEMREQLRRWADTIDEQAGRRTMDMQMHGFSPVRFMEEVRAFARRALSTTPDTESPTQEGAE